jgi:small subunit ribosomal protein S8
MPMTDPIADFLTRIRNAISARRADVACPSSNLKTRLAEVMKDEGYIQGYDVRDGFDGHSELVVRLDCVAGRVLANASTLARIRSRRFVRASASPSSPLPAV